MSLLQQLLDALRFIGNGDNYAGPDGIDDRLLQHVYYCVLALAYALVIGVPLGAFIGHTGRGARVILGSATALRALPSLGLMYLLATERGVGLSALIITLVILAVPPIMLSTMAGVAGVDPDAVDAAEGMGMTGQQVLLRVELPNALPVIFGGIRTAMLQLVATTSIAALITLEGLGQYIINGLAQQDYTQVLAGGVLIAGLAVVADLVLAVLQRLLVSSGLRRHAGPRRSPISLVRGPAREGTPA